jgi:hypothetical protein
MTGLIIAVLLVISILGSTTLFLIFTTAKPEKDTKLICAQEVMERNRTAVD